MYLKHAATLVLSHVLGPEVFGGFGITSWDERTAYLRKKESKKEGLQLLSASRDGALSTAEGASAGVPTMAPRTPSRVGTISSSNLAGSGASVSRGSATAATPGTPQGQTPKKRPGPSAGTSSAVPINSSVTAPTATSSSSSPRLRRERSISVGNINSANATNPTVSNSSSRGGPRGASPATKNKIAAPKVAVKASAPSIIPASADVTVPTPIFIQSSSVLLFPPLQDLGVNGNGTTNDHPNVPGLGSNMTESISHVPLVIPTAAAASTSSSLLDLAKSESPLAVGQMQQPSSEDSQDACKSATGSGSVSASSTSSVSSGFTETPPIATTTAAFCDNKQQIVVLVRSKPEGDACSRDAKEAENGYCHSDSKASAKAEATSLSSSSPPKKEVPSLETQSPNKELRLAIIASAAAAVVPTSRYAH